jgi:hypothetical protein
MMSACADDPVDALVRPCRIDRAEQDPGSLRGTMRGAEDLIHLHTGGDLVEAGLALSTHDHPMSNTDSGTAVALARSVATFFCGPSLRQPARVVVEGANTTRTLAWR